MNMRWKAAVALLVVAGLGVASGQADHNLPGCYPQWDASFPRPDCSDCAQGTHAQTSWQCWKGMYYIYFGKKMNKEDAEEYCGPWDEAVCKGEYIDGNDGRRWRAGLVSSPLEGEMEEAVVPAFHKACITPQTDDKNLFWSGGKSIYNGKLIFSDGSRVSTSLSSLGSGYCVAFDGSDGSMVKMPCSQELPFMCKIQPPSH